MIITDPARLERLVMGIEVLPSSHDFVCIALNVTKDKLTAYTSVDDSSIPATHKCLLSMAF